MSEKRFWIAAVLVLTALVATSAAYGQDEKNEISGMLGRTFVSDQRIVGATYINPFVRTGKGLTIEGDYARRVWVTPLYSISGEVPVVFNPREKLGSGGDVVPASYKSFFVTPAARLNLFPTNAVTPWVSFGAGIGHFSESDNLNYFGTNPGKSTTSATIQGGVGLDVRLKHRLFLRGEARDFWSGEPNYPLAATGHSRQHNYFVSGGVMWRF
jgi:hypothetical protein